MAFKLRMAVDVHGILVRVSMVLTLTLKTFEILVLLVFGLGVGYL